MLNRSRSSLSAGLLLLSVLGAVPVSAGSPAGVFRPTLVLGAALPAAGGVRVGADGAEWALPGGTRLVASADAELRVLGSPQRLDLGARRRVPTYAVVLKSGSLRVVVPETATTAVIVSAPRKTTVIVARGEASVIAGTEVAVLNNQGDTSVGVVGGAFRALPSGMVEVVGGVRRPLLDSPADLLSPSVLVTDEADVALGPLEFAAVSGAHGYRVELRDKASGRLLSRADTTAPSVPAGLSRLAPGAYAVRVVAVDSAGFESAHPCERPLRVVRLVLPPGAFREPNGVVHFPPGSRLALEGIGGVETSSGYTGAFVAAPSALDLLRNEPRLIRLRAVGATAVSQLWLVPHKARASVEFGSRTPRWPGAPLDIDLRVDDPSGRVEMRPLVTVGVETVPVDFRHEGGSLRGSLPPQAGAGPWVVRVEVKDQHGLLLGRDFVEVSPAARAE